jgi:L-asparaginase
MAERRSRVYVLYTGGTLGMVPRFPDNPASPLVPGTQEQLEKYMPAGLNDLVNVDYKFDSLRDLDGNPVDPIDSSDVNSKHWMYMASAIDKVYNGERIYKNDKDKEGTFVEYDGFVILHGTDTMAYTSSALSFMLVNLAKPVVITGAQLPISEPRTDAISNFVNALYVAGHRSTGLTLIPEVILVFAGAILRGNRVRKMSSSAWQGFDTPNYPHLGSIGEHIRIASEYLRSPANNEAAPFYARLDLDSQIADVSLFPGIQPEQLGAILLNETLRGAVLRTFGSGNAPGDPRLLSVIDQSVKAGKVIVNVTQCPEGMVEAGLYEASSGLLERGVISGLDLTPEAALTKLMSLLANEPRDDVAAQMQLDLRGEQSASLFDVRFGGTKVDGETDTGPTAPGQVGQDRPDLIRTETSVTLAARPAGSFDTANLQQATIRLRGLHISRTTLEAGTKVTVDVYLNHPRATVGAASDPRRAARLEAEIGEESHLLADVTAVARRVLEGGRAIQLTLVPTVQVVGADGDLVDEPAVGELDFDGAFLALFTR